MSFHEKDSLKRSLRRQTAVPLTPLSQALIAASDITAEIAEAADAEAEARGLDPSDVLSATHGIACFSIAEANATMNRTANINPLTDPPDPRLIASFGVHRVLQTGVLPWRQMADVTVILCARASQFAAAEAALIASFGPVRMAIAAPNDMESVLHNIFGPMLAEQAELRVAAAESSRNLDPRRALAAMLAFTCLLAVAAVISPILTFGLLCGAAVAMLALTTALKLAALFFAPSGYGATPLPEPDQLPLISLLIPLHDETALADHLITRLEALDYPRALLDVCLVLEGSDATTRHAIGQATLPTWMRVIVVPDGTLRTKPRALNYALTFARGSLIGVYDAEDAPATDQLHLVAREFAASGPRVACLQGTLDYYNAGANWLTRCFTIEYASWFRVVLPGMARMGLVVPLGGTTLFLRRDVLEKLGGWDAHNVTEDADLGIRLARHGYSTRFFASVTEEEANGRAWPWVKQRARWLKGYAVTYGVHMRRPGKLYRDLGLWRFCGVQVLLGGTLLQFLLAPLLWSFWLLPFGLPHPLHGVAPSALLWTLGGFFLLAEITNISIGIVAVRRAGKGWLAKWTPTLQLYFPLAAVAAYKGLAEIAWKPFYWDKTAHGIFAPPIPPPPRPSRPASDG